jgi:hypothetical protein
MGNRIIISEQEKKYIRSLYEINLNKERKKMRMDLKNYEIELGKISKAHWENTAMVTNQQNPYSNDLFADARKPFNRFLKPGERFYGLYHKYDDFISSNVIKPIYDRYLGKEIKLDNEEVVTIESDNESRLWYFLPKFNPYYGGRLRLTYIVGPFKFELYLNLTENTKDVYLINYPESHKSYFNDVISSELDYDNAEEVANKLANGDINAYTYLNKVLDEIENSLKSYFSKPSQIPSDYFYIGIVK